MDCFGGIDSGGYFYAQSRDPPQRSRLSDIDRSTASRHPDQSLIAHQFRGGADELFIAAGNSSILLGNFSAASGSSLRDWEQRTFTLQSNTSILSMCYAKNDSEVSGEDRAWVDNLSFTVPPTKAEVCSALDMSTADCALITGVSITLPSGVTLPQGGCCRPVATAVPWFVSTVRTAGANSLRSGDINDTEASCLVLAVSLPDTRQLRFSLRTSSQGQHDRLAFFIDDQTVISNFSAPERSETKNWEQQNFVVTNSVSKLSWCYLKNAADSAGDDSGWLDNLSFIPFSPVCGILDMSNEECGLITATSYEPPGSPWSANSTATLGSDSLRSRGVRSSQQSCLILNVSLPDRTLVQFSRRVNSQPADELYFSIDDVRQEYSLRPAATAALRDWSREVHILFESGDKVLSWCYVKDASGTEGADRAWIDDLSLIAPPAAPLNRDVVCLVLDMSLEDCELITSYASVPPDPSWYISYFNSEGGFSNGETSLRSDPAVDDNRFSCLVLGVTLPADTRIGFSLRTDSEGGRDFLYFEADGVRLIENYSAPLNSNIRDFEPLEFEVTNPVSELRWCYQKDAILSVGDDSVWLDRLYFSAADDPSNFPLTRGQICMALDMSADDCALITGFSTTLPTGLTLPQTVPQITQNTRSEPGNVPWVVSDVPRQGGSSLRSGNIDNSQASCLVLAAALPAGTVINFALRSSSEGFHDRLAFAADTEVLIESFSAPTQQTLREWEAQQTTVTNRVSNLSWCYLKDFNTDEGEDAGWLDALSFTLPPGLTLPRVCAALDMSADDCTLITGVSTTLPTGLTLPSQGNASIPGDVPWSVSDVAAIQGGSSLRSGDIGDSQASCLVLATALPAGSVIGFSLTIRAQAVSDRLAFAADTEVLIENFSATSGSFRGWEAQEITLSNSISNLSWCYLKNDVTSRNSDAVWLDRLSFIPLPPRGEPLNRGAVCRVLDMSTSDCTLITHIGSDPAAPPWYISNLNSEGDHSLRSDPEVDHRETSCLVLGVALPGDRTIRFFLRTSSQGGNDFLYFEADGARLIRNFSAPSGSSLRDFEEVNVFLAGDISKLAWCYTKNGSGNAGDDSGWLDRLSFSAAGARTSIALTPGLVCQALDLSADNCALIDSVAADPPGRPWVLSDIATEGSLSLRSGDSEDSQTSCLVLGVTLPDDRSLRFSLRTDSEAANDFFVFRGGWHQTGRHIHRCRRLHSQGLGTAGYSDFGQYQQPEMVLHQKWQHQCRRRQRLARCADFYGDWRDQRCTLRRTRYER